MMNEHTKREIAKFDALATDFWNLEGDFKALHQINPIRIDFCAEFLDLKGANVADIGCGGGILSEALDKQGAQVTAIDLSEEGINAAKEQQRITHSKVDYRVQSVADFSSEVKSHPLDAVFCMEMLEHVNNPEEIINDCAKMVKENGIVVFSTINRTKKAHLLAVFLAENLLGMVPKGTHDPALFIKPSEMQKMAVSAGLTPLDIIGFEFRPWHNDFIRSRNTQINYIFAFQKNRHSVHKVAL